jgi:hypothetical protein
MPSIPLGILSNTAMERERVIVQTQKYNIQEMALKEPNFKTI